MLIALFASRIPKRKHICVNVSDQISIFAHETKMLLSVCWKCFLTFNVLDMTRTDGWIQIFLKKKRCYSPTNTITLLCTIVTRSVLLICVIQRLVTSDGSDGTQNVPGHPDNEWG